MKITLSNFLPHLELVVFHLKVDERTGESFTDIYSTKINKKGKWSVPMLTAEPINTSSNEGSVFLNRRGTNMYLTKCNVEKKKAEGCSIFISTRKGKIWGEPKKTSN